MWELRKLPASLVLHSAQSSPFPDLPLLFLHGIHFRENPGGAFTVSQVQGMHRRVPVSILYYSPVHRNDSSSFRYDRPIHRLGEHAPCAAVPGVVGRDGYKETGLVLGSFQGPQTTSCPFTHSGEALLLSSKASFFSSVSASRWNENPQHHLWLQGLHSPHLPLLTVRASCEGLAGRVIVSNLGTWPQKMGQS